ncbi:hypothetical protein MHYP_G00311090 [Metynnis hypsauchen]
MEDQDFKFFLKLFHHIMPHVDLLYAKLQKKVIDSVYIQENIQQDSQKISATLLQGNRFEQYNTAFPEDALSNTIKAYPVLHQGELKTELSLIYSKEEFKACCGAVDLFQLFMQNNLEEVFPETVRLLKILITTPMSTAEAERCFSTLKRTDFSEKLSDPGQAECIGHVSGEKTSHRDDRLYQECH